MCLINVTTVGHESGFLLEILLALNECRCKTWCKELQHQTDSGLLLFSDRVLDRHTKATRASDFCVTVLLVSVIKGGLLAARF